MPNEPGNDPFHLHRLALRPLLHTLDRQQTTALFSELELLDPTDFIIFVHQQGLAQMWLPFLQAHALPSNWQTTIGDLKQDALTTAASQLMQRKASADTHQAFRDAGIDYLVFKGANLRDTIYDDPTHRPVCDIDILVREESKFDAIKALQQAGFSSHHLAENISHETSMLRQGVWLDLHWHLLRPGRTRIDLNDYLFSQRRAFGKLQGLSNEASLLVMLIHPAISKYVNGTASSLRHLVDIHRLAQQDDIDWERLVAMLEAAGTKTAAWASLAWLNMLSDAPMYADLAGQLRPSGLKARWLGYWMGKGLNRKFAERRVVLRVGFSLMLQDNLKDVVHAVRTLKEEKDKTAATMQAFEQISPR